MCSNYPGIKLEPALGTKEDKIGHLVIMLTSSTQLQNRSFHVVEKTRTSSKCQKMKNARGKRAKILFFIVKYANLWGFCCRRRRGCLSSLLLACIQDEILGRTERAKGINAKLEYRNIFANCKIYYHFCFLLSLFINYYRIHQ